MGPLELFLRDFLMAFSWFILDQILDSAPSRMAQVMMRTTSATFTSSVFANPALFRTDQATSVSLTFIWHP
uniref:Putative secreted protein n=1 Tax=Ixodes ricinus TaxID=34613 RepID=A0A6B0TS42_IXORI